MILFEDAVTPGFHLNAQRLVLSQGEEDIQTIKVAMSMNKYG